MDLVSDDRQKRGRLQNRFVRRPFCPESCIRPGCPFRLLRTGLTQVHSSNGRTTEPAEGCSTAKTTAAINSPQATGRPTVARTTGHAVSPDGRDDPLSSSVARHCAVATCQTWTKPDSVPETQRGGMATRKGAVSGASCAHPHCLIVAVGEPPGRSLSEVGFVFKQLLTKY